MNPSSYTASDIEVLEGLEAVRRRPGMYVGGTDLRALHHLVAEVLDNAMDEAVAGFANRIDIQLQEDGSVVVGDNGRGIPVDPHPRYPDKSALEVILTTLHSGGKFHNKVYATAGGLHGVGVSVVNALSVWTEVTVEREGAVWRQRFSQGRVQSPLEQLGKTRGRGTRVAFLPDPAIFGELRLQPEPILEMCRAKAYLNRGVVIRVTVGEGGERHQFHFPNGLGDFIRDASAGKGLVDLEPFTGRVEKVGGEHGRVEWAMTWTTADEPDVRSYCNAIPTREGGTHEAGMRSALVRSFREYAETRGLLPRGVTLQAEDVLAGLIAVLSVFIPEPQFSGQTKERLSNPEVGRQVDALVKDHLDHWLHGKPEHASRLVGSVIERARDRISRKKAATVKRKTPTARLTLPGKLTDCIATDPALSELFIVEGDSAGGSAKQARDRNTQAVLPLRGKILNVEQANLEKFEKNAEIQSLITALGTGWGKQFDLKGLRYGRIIIMTDADVDGAHIASLLLTFFYRYTPELVRRGHLFLAQPPLYRLTVGGQTVYALDDREKERAVKRLTTGRQRRAKVEVSRFKGLGEMDPGQLRETTMSPRTRRLLKVFVDDEARTDDTFDRLMGRRPQERFLFIQERAAFAQEGLDI